MGLEDTAASAPGFYNGRTVNALADADNDYAACDAAQKQVIRDRIKVYAKAPLSGAYFFYLKTSSQWNDPTGASLFQSSFTKSETVGATAQRWYMQNANEGIFAYMNGVQLLVYALAFFSALAGLIRKETFSHTALLLVIWGGFFYLLLSEGKAQYVLPYFALSIPFAAHGAAILFEKRRAK